ncbi:uncharacterized protein [Leptinotarsa decemlineata]|uniref:uncharacterized protein n=1 Tax=Leptinotarsa decemlineata TaxID=7539 RepID=UPI003D3069D1
MPRVYVRTSQRGQSYTQETLRRAVEEIRNGVIRPKRAAGLYRIPLSTIRDHLKGRRGTKSSSFGRPPALPEEHEQKLANCLKQMETWGFGLSRLELLDIVKQYVDKNNLKTPFKFNKPGEDWFINFKKRHSLSIKKPQSIEYARKNMTDPFIIYPYFNLLKQTLQDLELMNQPDKIWNLDESSLCPDPSKTKVVGGIGKTVSRTVSSPGRENTTILAAVNAAGKKAPPLILFKAKNLWNSWIPENEIFPGTAHGATKNGWMEADVFYNYLAKTLIPTMGAERPQLLIYDGHSTHVTEKVIELAIQENITILKLPPHTSHLLQPLDLSVFKPLKDKWDAKLVTWQRHNIGVKVPKVTFSTMVQSSWLELLTETISNGFKKAGIFPYNPNVISENVFDPESLKRWKRTQEETPQETQQETTQETPPQVENIEPVASTSAEPNLPNGKVYQPPNVSFEQLLLETIKQSKKDPITKRKRIAPVQKSLPPNRLKQNWKRWQRSHVKRKPRWHLKQANLMTPP